MTRDDADEHYAPPPLGRSTTDSKIYEALKQREISRVVAMSQGKQHRCTGNSCGSFFEGRFINIDQSPFTPLDLKQGVRPLYSVS